MKPGALFLVLAAVVLAGRPAAYAAAAAPRPPSNITVVGTVFCDICSNNTFSKNSYFLGGAKVRVDCSFKSTATAKEQITVSAERTTDRFGVYRLDVPPVDGLECREGRDVESFCRASLLHSATALCDVPGLSISTEHLAVRCTPVNLCLYNLNALNYRPAKRDHALCGGVSTAEQVPPKPTDASLFFWPPFPPFGLPWPFPHRPPFPFPFPFPFPSPSSSFPFPFPFPFHSSTPSLPFPFSKPPPSFPFPFPSPPPKFPFPFPDPSPEPPSFPFPLPPSGFSPSPPPPAFLFPLPPPLFAPSSPPPPSYRFPFPPFPPLSPWSFVLTPSPPPPSPPPPSFPLPFPPFPPNPFAPAPPSPSPSPPPPPRFSLRDPSTRFPPNSTPPPGEPRSPRP